jgi:hypothetical protein
MVNNNRNNSCIVASGVYTWVRLKAVDEISSVSELSSCLGPVSTYISSSAVRVALSVSSTVTRDRSRSAKTLEETSQINSLALSGFTEQHAPSSEPEGRTRLPAVF